MVSAQHHRVVRNTIFVHHSFTLVPSERDARVSKDGCVLESQWVHDAELVTHVLVDVCAEPHRFSRIDRPAGDGLENTDWHIVQFGPFDTGTVFHIVEVFHGVASVVGSCRMWVVNHRDIVLNRKVLMVHILAVKFDRC